MHVKGHGGREAGGRKEVVGVHEGVRRERTRGRARRREGSVSGQDHRAHQTNVTRSHYLLLLLLFSFFFFASQRL